MGDSSVIFTFFELLGAFFMLLFATTRFLPFCLSLSTVAEPPKLKMATGEVARMGAD